MGRYSIAAQLGKLIIPLLALILLSGCGSKKTLVVLVPDPGGKTGTVTVSNSSGTADIATANQATTISGPNTPPSKPAPIQQQEIDRIFSRALQAQPARPIHFLLYFVSDSNKLTEESLNRFPDILQTIKDRNSIDISIVGHTDTKGSKDYNNALAKNRAEAVGGLLGSRGVPPDHIRTTSHGEENPLIPTEDNVDEPKNRRVEVVVR